MRFPLPSRIAAAPLALVVFATACGGGEQADADAAPEIAPEEVPTVRIVQPEDGATVGPDVTILLETEGIEIVSITPRCPAPATITSTWMWI